MNERPITDEEAAEVSSIMFEHLGRSVLLVATLKGSDNPALKKVCRALEDYVEAMNAAISEATDHHIRKN